ncbi:MAG TPA: type II toxin-antitoxin system RelE/ParE family toxin [Pyrinomonadaceae bacterium]|nr:type II toxin-antitoxin system RelE/ParE family toxin [Pyrinomonadaceae bacterium]
MKIDFLDAAKSELDDAIAYYDEQRFGSGLEFEEELEQALERIDHPEAWSPLSSRVCRCVLNRFPYSVIYSIRSETIIIVAIQHHHKEPEGWRSRVY